MPRAHVYQVLQNLTDGSLITPTSVRVLQDGTTTLVTDTLWTSEAGSGVLTNPFTPTSPLIEFWLDNPQRIQLGITPPGSGEVFKTYDAEPDGMYVVTSAVANLSLGTPLAGMFLHVNGSGQIEYVAGAEHLYIETIVGGVLAVANDIVPPGLRVPESRDLIEMHLAVGTAPVGGPLTVEVKHRSSGTLIGTASIAAGATTGSVTGLAVPVTADERLQFDVTAIGPTSPGSDLAISVVLL